MEKSYKMQQIYFRSYLALATIEIANPGHVVVGAQSKFGETVKTE